MKRKNLTALCSIKDDARYGVVAEGIDHILSNAVYLAEQAISLKDAGKRASAILEDLASEEAAKIFILYDLIRCPSASKFFSRQIGKFYEHLARLIYANYYQCHFTDFEEVRSWVDVHRQAFYTDGDDDSGWFIFDNALLRQREEKLYVDYFSDGQNNRWTVPYPEEFQFEAWNAPTILSTARLLNEVGTFSEGALKIAANIWRPVEINKDTQRQALDEKMFLGMAEDGLLLTTDANVIKKGINQLRWPLYPLDLKMDKPKISGSPKPPCAEDEA